MLLSDLHSRYFSDLSETPEVAGLHVIRATSAKGLDETIAGGGTLKREHTVGGTDSMPYMGTRTRLGRK